MKKTGLLAALVVAAFAANASFAEDAKSTDKLADQAAEELNAKLEAAQERLEAAAREVAELSAKLTRPVVRHLMVMGKPPSRAVIGVQLDPTSGKDGARVVEVSPGGAAADAGVKVGDLIVGLNGEKISDDRSALQVTRLMRDIEPGSQVKLRVMRAGEPREFELTARAPVDLFVSRAGLGAPAVPLLPPDIALASRPGADSVSLFRMLPSGLPDDGIAGMELATLTPALSKYFGTDKGVLVLRAPESSAFKIEEGDVILAIGGREPTSGSHATRILRSYLPGEKMELKIMRERRTLNLHVALPEPTTTIHGETGVVSAPDIRPNIRYQAESST